MLLPGALRGEAVMQPAMAGGHHAGSALCPQLGLELRGCPSWATGGMGQPQELPGLCMEGAFCRLEGENGQERGCALPKIGVSAFVYSSAAMDGTG